MERFRISRRHINRRAFSPNEPGCVVDTPAYWHDETGNRVEVEQRYLRLKVKNVGRSAAQGIRVSVIRIAFNSTGGNSAQFEGETLDLPVALYDRASFDLSAGEERYVDVFAVEGSGTELIWRFGFPQQPARLDFSRYGRGVYNMTVRASATNAQPKDRDLQWHWDGTLHGASIPTYVVVRQQA